MRGLVVMKRDTAELATTPRYRRTGGLFFIIRKRAIDS
jgi:hypothetical protein